MSLQQITGSIPTSIRAFLTAFAYLAEDAAVCVLLAVMLPVSLLASAFRLLAPGESPSCLWLMLPLGAMLLVLAELGL